MTSRTSASQAAERSRRYRARRREGSLIARVEILKYDADALVAAGFLDADERTDRALVGGAVELFLEALSRGVVDLDFEAVETMLDDLAA